MAGIQKNNPEDFKYPLFLLCLYGLAFLLLGGVVVAGHLLDRPFGYFSRDVATLTSEAAYIGLISNLGIILWCAAATLCFFSAWLLKKKDHRSWTTFFWGGGFFSSLLLADDLFLIHESAFWVFGIPEWAVHGAMIGLLIGFFYTFRRTLLRTRFIPLLASALFFALHFIWEQSDFYLLEDGFKLLAIVGWFGYFADTSFVRIRKGVEGSERDRS